MPRFTQVALLLALLGILSPGDSLAQIDYMGYTIGVRSPQQPPCEPDGFCAEWCACSTPTGVPTTGTYEFLIFSSPEANQLGLRFALDMPQDWQVLSASTCVEVGLDEGDLLNPSEGIQLSFESCRFWDKGGAVATLVVECPTPGACFMVPRPGESSVMDRPCNGDWRNASEPFVQRVNVGDFCGRIDTSPCNLCIDKPSGEFEPMSLSWELFPEEEDSKGLLVRGYDFCSVIPECGGGNGECFGSLEGDVDWLSIEFVEQQSGFRFVYELTASSAGLKPGIYQGRVWASPLACSGCTDACMDVEMRIQPPTSDAPDLGPSVPFRIHPHPNPSSESIAYTLQLPEAGRVSVRLYAVDGRLVRTLLSRSLAGGRQVISHPADPTLTSGTYFLEADLGGRVARSRLSVIRR